MRWCRAAVVGLVLVCLPAGEALGQPVDHELIVRYAAGVSAAERADVRADAGAALERDMLLPRLELVATTGGAARSSLERRLAADPRVERVERNDVVRALATPDDPLFAQLWGMPLISAPEAWDATTGSSDVVVAVVDTGVDTTHSDLAPNAWVNAGEVAGNGVDDDGNGFTDDHGGWDFSGNDNVPTDGDGHGTHVAGTIGARGGNALGVAGVTWSTRIMPVKVLDDTGSGSWADVADGITYAAQNGAAVMNLSLGGESASTAVRDAIAAASDSLLAVAAGNDGGDVDLDPAYPCAFPAANVVCVAATNATDHLASFSNTGAAGVDLAAPGVGILSTLPGDDPVFPDTISTFETFEAADFAARWTTSGTAAFTRTAEKAAGGAGFSMTDSPGSEYLDSAALTATAVDALEADPARPCAVGFDLAQDLESNYDYLHVEASTNGGQSWTSLRRFTGTRTGFAPVVAPLPAATASFRLRFRMTTDFLIVDDGVHIDNVRVQCRSAAGPVGTYGTLSGTSMATPHVAGAAALLWADDPSLSVAEVKTALMSAGDPLADLAGATVSGRRLNVARALAFDVPTVGTPAVSALTPSQATLTTLADHHGLGGTWHVEYGRRGDGALDALPAAALPAQDGSVELVRTLSGLDPSTVYDAAVVVETAAGRREAKVTFTTGGEVAALAPAVEPPAAGAAGPGGEGGVAGAPQSALPAGPPLPGRPQGTTGGGRSAACLALPRRVRCSGLPAGRWATVRVVRSGRTVRTVRARIDARGRLRLKRRGLGRGRFALVIATRGGVTKLPLRIG